MLYPSINDLLKIADSRYALVNEVSKRARQIVDGSDMLIDTDDIKIRRWIESGEYCL